MLTALDQIANQSHLLLIKAVIPYLPPGSQRLISTLAKLLELKNVMAFYGSRNACIHACGESPEPPTLTEILTDIRNYCEEADQAMVDQWLQIVSVMDLYTAFAGNTGDQESPGSSWMNLFSALSPDLYGMSPPPPFGDSPDSDSAPEQDSTQMFDSGPGPESEVTSPEFDDIPYSDSTGSQSDLIE